MSLHIKQIQTELEQNLGFQRSEKQKKQDEINRFASNLDMNNEEFSKSHLVD